MLVGSGFIKKKEKVEHNIRNAFITPAEKQKEKKNIASSPAPATTATDEKNDGDNYNGNAYVYYTAVGSARHGHVVVLLYYAIYRHACATGTRVEELDH